MAIPKTKNWREDRGGYFADIIRKADESDRSDLLMKLAENRAMYYKEAGGFEATEEEGPWEGAANLHIPVITEKVETATPKVMSALWRANPFVNVSRPGGSDFNQEQAKNMENYLSWAFRNDIPGFYLTLENFLRNMFIDGTAFAKIRWDRRTRRAIEMYDLEMFEKAEEGAEDQPLERPIRSADNLLAEIFGLGDPDQTLFEAKQLSESVFEVKFTEQGQQYSGRVEFSKARRFDRVTARVFRDVLEADNPAIDLVEIEDLVFPSRAKTLQSAKWLAHKTWYSYKEIEELVRTKQWSLTAKQLRTLKGNRRVDEDSGINEHERLKDSLTGLEPADKQESPSPDGTIDPNKIMVWEIYTSDYVDDYADPINVVYFLPEHVRTIAGMEYQDEIFPHGQRPFVSATYIPIPDRIYGTGMAELLYGVNKSIDHTINSVHNNMTLTTTPWGMISPMAMAQNGAANMRIVPGELMVVNDPKGAYFPNFAQQPLEQYHASYRQMEGIADALTFSRSVDGNSNYTNAPRTARGTTALLSAAEDKLATIVEQLQATAWKDMIIQVSALYGRYLTIDKWYQVTGEAQARHISPKELRQNTIFEFTGSLTSVNRDLQRTYVQQLYTTLANEPLYQSDPQAKQNLITVFAKAFGENLDVESIVPMAPGQRGADHAPYTQEQENRIISTGEHVSVLMNDDHMQHLKELEKFIKTEVFMNLPDTIKGMFAAHHADHSKAFQKASAQQQQAANSMGTGQAQQQQQGMPAQPGVPTEGQPAMGGEMSLLGGVT